MKNGEKNTIYLIGIGGIGMSALARYYHNHHYIVAGYDRTPSPLTKQLESEGIAIHYEDNPNLLPSCIAFAIFTPAVPNTLKELETLRQSGIPVLKRSEALGKISNQHFTIAIAGTHGKTTTTAMVAHILNHSGINTTAFIGGIANNFNSNLLLGKGENEILVAEADEFDRSFLRLHPDISIINSIDEDHLDIYGDRKHLQESFNEFAQLTKQSVIVKEGLDIQSQNKVTFGFGSSCNYTAKVIATENGTTFFSINSTEGDVIVKLPMPGRHNILNATAAFAAARAIGTPSESIVEALSTFKGVKRRFDIRVNDASHCYIDDYAHHPEEIRACLTAIKESFIGKRITLVFQPHLFSRTRDFMNEFASVLAMADELILLDIYPARELPIEGITSEALLKKVQIPKKGICQKSDLIQLIDSKKPELLVTMGAGDIDRFVEPLEKLVKSW